MTWMPHWVECTGFSFGYSLPEMAIKPPRSGSSTPEMILMRVDLPDPFSPTMQCTSPASSVRLTSRSACTPPKRLEMPDNSRKVAKGSSLESLGNQPGEGLLVDPHDLVDLDLLAGNIDRRLAKARDLDTVSDRLAVEHELGDG